MLQNEDREKYETELNGITIQREQLKKTLQDTNRELAKERDSLIKSRRGDISGNFDKQVKAIDAQLRAISDKRQKARNQGVKARVEERTAALVQENASLRERLSNLYKDNGVPAFCRSSLFFICTMPHGIGEKLGALGLFILAFGLLPGVINLLIPGENFLIWAAVYFVDILLFGALYVSMSNQKAKHIGVIRQGRGIRDQIQANDRQIKKITREIRRDKDDALYDLQSFDDELARNSQGKEDILRKKAEALEQFDAVTRNVLADETAERYKPKIAELSEQLSAAEQKIKELEERLKDYGKTGDDQGNIQGQR
ncbi:MAG: hypothetical protein Q4C63_06965 [Eubacteriales bacterium]|nr:hypothetical protein [Eubacteriales bacterium]